VKRDLCLFAYVSGRRYQPFIPLFLYSILKSYGEAYFPRVFVHQPLAGSVRRLLPRLRALGAFEIRESVFAARPVRKDECKALRWLLPETEFEGFDHLYGGDVDIFVCPEDPPLLEQHRTHAGAMGLPYSNAVRPLSHRKLWKGAESLPAMWRQIGPLHTLRFLCQPPITIRQLTGLHFMLKAEYFAAVGPLLPTYREIVFDRSMASRRNTLHHMGGFNNECLLLDMLRESGLELPPPGPLVFDYRQSTSPHFAPHHGLHLRAFLSREAIRNNHPTSLSLPVYREYYEKFRGITAGDALFAEILATSPPDIRTIFRNMERYYA